MNPEPGVQSLIVIRQERFRLRNLETGGSFTKLSRGSHTLADLALIQRAVGLFENTDHRQLI